MLLQGIKPQNPRVGCDVSWFSEPMMPNIRDGHQDHLANFEHSIQAV